ncbi:MAG: ABC-2 family transporter protein [Elusimicrobia bacterium]|nr:ABC-2 family transporter protein [Elusimicrobiota bacterium]
MGIEKYLTAYSIALQQVLQRRASLLMDRVGGIAVIVSLYYFWKALLGQKSEFLGYSGEQMLSYVLAMNLLRAFVFTGRGWELVGDISSGRIASYLVRPISYHGYSLALDMAQKTVHLFAALLEIGVLILLVQAPVYQPAEPATWPLFAVAVLLSSLIFFFLEFTVSSMAFWTSESGGPLFCFELFLQFAAGTFFPLDVLPKSLQAALSLTPFPYMVFFPINIYLERVPLAQAAQIIGMQCLWLALFAAMSVWVWRVGLQSYSAEGG